MTVDDARVRLTAALDDPTAARWLTPDYIAAIRLVLDALSTREQSEDVTWAGAVQYVRDLAAAIRHMRKAFIADPAMGELAIVRAEALESCADSMEQAAKKARALGRDTETP